jgi:hypothetical protein
VDIAADIIAGAALLVSIGGYALARRSDRSAKRSADAAELAAQASIRAADATEERLAIESQRRHEQRRPRLLGMIQAPDAVWMLTLTLDPDCEPLAEFQLSVRPDQGFTFQVDPTFGGIDDDLHAHGYGYGSEKAGLRPGESMFWWGKLAEEHDDVALIDAMCIRNDSDPWQVLIRAEIQAIGDVW